jgi:hypothetical protein
MESSQRAGHPSRIQVTGPLAPYAAAWRAELAARGFARHSVLAHAQLMAHLSAWMTTAGHDAGSLTDEVICGYLEARRAAGYRARAGGRGLSRSWRLVKPRGCSRNEVEAWYLALCKSDPDGCGNMGLILDPRVGQHVVWPAQTACDGHA